MGTQSEHDMFGSTKDVTDNVEGEIVSVERGEYVVPTRSNSFGEVLEHGLSQPVFFVALPKLHSWKPFRSICLSHQTYKKKVEKKIRDSGRLREVAVMGTETGEWVTVWTADGHDAIHPKDTE